MKKVLDMPFVNLAGKEVLVTLANPREGLTKAEVAAVMTNIVAKNVFTSTGGEFVSAGDPVIRLTDTEVLV